MTHEEAISWLEYLSEDARSKADGLVPTNIEIACGMAIDALKAQEPTSTPKAEWLLYKGRQGATCSFCKHTYHDVYDVENYDYYCRHCGAKMVRIRTVKWE